MRTIQARALIAFSTPAQNPRGDAKMTFSTVTLLSLGGIETPGIAVETCSHPLGWSCMPHPSILRVSPGSPAERGGVVAGDALVAVNGVPPRDIIDYQQLVDGPDPIVTIERSGLELELPIDKPAGTLVGMEISDALFDKVRTCDNHCEFCFIYQLPKGLRRTLYVKDDDYRLSFLYGNFTTLTRFTEADLQRVIEEHLSPLYVSMHTTNPQLRAEMLRNKKGMTSLRFLKALLENDIVVHGQIVVCPGVNDGIIFEESLAGILEEYPKLASVAAVPLGISRYSTEDRMRAHTPEEVNYILDAVQSWQEIFQQALGHRMIFAADEYYLLAGREFPESDYYEGFPQLENGIGLARAFIDSFEAKSSNSITGRGGFFQSVDGAPSYGYRSSHLKTNYPKDDQSLLSEKDSKLLFGQEAAMDVEKDTDKYFSEEIKLSTMINELSVADQGFTETKTSNGCKAAQGEKSVGKVGVSLRMTRSGKTVYKRDRSQLPITLISSYYGKKVLEQVIGNYLSDSVRENHIDILAVDNDFFGGNTSVTGLLVGEDLFRALAKVNPERRYILPDICLNEGRFLDGMTPDDLPIEVEIIPAEGDALRKLLDEATARVACGS